MKYIDELIANCHKTKAAQPSKEFVLTDDSRIEAAKQGIYITEELGGNPEQRRDAMTAYKTLKERKCPKLNEQASSILYVGSSTTGLLNRIEQHRGKGPNKPTQCT